MTMDPAILATLGLALVSSQGKALTLKSASNALRAHVDRDPLQATLATVLGSAILFYRAEHGVNPKVKRFEDALVYCSTSISVGFSDIFAQTPTGKMIGSFLMTLGPALAPRALDAPR
jgi:Ion channel